MSTLYSFSIFVNTKAVTVAQYPFGDVYYYIYFESDNQMHLLQDHDKLTSYINKSRQVVAVAHNKF